MKIPKLRNEKLIPTTVEMSKMIKDSLYNKSIVPGKSTIKATELKEFYKDAKNELKEINTISDIDRGLLVSYQSPQTLLRFVKNSEFLNEYKDLIKLIKADEYFTTLDKYIKGLDNKRDKMYLAHKRIETLYGLVSSLFLDTDTAKIVVDKAMNDQALEARDITLEQAYSLVEIFEKTTKYMKIILEEKKKGTTDLG